MTCKKLILFMLLMLLAATGAVQAACPEKPGPADKCPVCGMFVAKYPDWIARLGFQDGSCAFFDGVKDLMKFYFQPGSYKSAKKVEDISSILVTDYYTLNLIDGKKAFYVIGSDVYGPMGKELIPFAGEKTAREFLKDHKGKEIVSFAQITPELIRTLD